MPKEIAKPDGARAFRPQSPGKYGQEACVSGEILIIGLYRMKRKASLPDGQAHGA